MINNATYNQFLKSVIQTKILPLDVSVHIQATRDIVSKLISWALLTGPRHREHKPGYKRDSEALDLKQFLQRVDLLDKIAALAHF